MRACCFWVCLGYSSHLSYGDVTITAEELLILSDTLMAKRSMSVLENGRLDNPIFSK